MEIWPVLHFYFIDDGAYYKYEIPNKKADGVWHHVYRGKVRNGIRDTRKYQYVKNSIFNYCFHFLVELIFSIAAFSSFEGPIIQCFSI